MAINRINKEFSYEVTLAASAEEYYDFENDRATDQYAPFKNVTVLNTGSAAIKMYANNQSGFRLIPAGTILQLEDQDLSYLKFVNASATLAAAFTVQLNNDYSQKEYLRELVNLQRGN